MPLRYLVPMLCCLLGVARTTLAQSNPIVFVTQVPLPTDFGTVNAVFANHRGGVHSAGRGGDLWIRYPDGALKNLTLAAGYGMSGLQTAQSIAVRDPAVSWDGTRVLFSMVIGAPAQYDNRNFFFQLYEVTGLGRNDTPVITKVPRQPEGVNNVMPVYGSDDRIIFVSDRALKGLEHTWPQLDEYESTPTNTGIWSLDPATGHLEHLDHAPSGDFDPLVDSFGRVVFSRWDHLQRDQQNAGGSYNAFNYERETDSRATTSRTEWFPEPRSIVDPDFIPTVNTHTINQFFPWMMSERGFGLETLNHIGRHELSSYIPQSFNNDSGLEEYYGQYSRLNEASLELFLHPREDPTRPGLYLGVNGPEFETHAAGQLVSLAGAPMVNPEDMALTPLTHPDTAEIAVSPGPGHSGFYRDPLPLADGTLLAVHTAATSGDENIGTRENPRSRYDFRIKRLVKGGSYYTAGTPLTPGIVKTLRFYDPDVLVQYSNVTMWELQPVEVVARPRPTPTEPPLPAIEAGVIAAAGVELAELREFLIRNELALVVSRNVTRRDAADHQQPRNLRIGATETRADDGKIYDIAHLQFFQGELLRGYRDSGGAPRPGRRVLARPMPGAAANPASDGPPGSVAISEDGSMAAFVPAGRALSWQTTDTTGTPVVRERYWLTFQKGEIRVCGSCHGVNRVDQAGNSEPTNPPLALTRLLEHWRGLDPVNPPPAPTATPAPGRARLELRTVDGRPLQQIRRRKPFDVHLRGGSPGETLTIDLTATPGRCRHRLGTVMPNGSGQARLRVEVRQWGAAPRARFTATRAARVVARSRVISLAEGAKQGTSSCRAVRIRPIHPDARS